MNAKDAKFYRPLWIRLLLTGIVTVWFVLEIVLSHDQTWIAITGAAIAYCVWNFFLRFPKLDTPTTETPATDTPPIAAPVPADAEPKP